MTEDRIDDSTPTCGKGLAEHSVLPARMAEVIAALADNLAMHMPTLDLSDANARKEYDAYDRLENSYRGISSRLQTTAQQMAGYRDLAMGRHDDGAMSNPKILLAFERYVKLEEELLSVLQENLRQDREMLGTFGRASGGATQ
jgi:hypothetical protein